MGAPHFRHLAIGDCLGILDCLVAGILQASAASKISTKKQKPWERFGMQTEKLRLCHRACNPSIPSNGRRRNQTLLLCCKASVCASLSARCIFASACRLGEHQFSRFHALTKAAAVIAVIGASPRQLQTLGAERLPHPSGPAWISKLQKGKAVRLDASHNLRLALSMA